MGCLQQPSIVPPTLPPGVTIGQTTPPIPVNLALCCQIAAFTIPPLGAIIPIPFPPAIVTAFNGYMSALKVYFDALQVPCPLD